MVGRRVWPPEHGVGGKLRAERILVSTRRPMESRCALRVRRASGHGEAATLRLAAHVSGAEPYYRFPIGRWTSLFGGRKGELIIGDLPNQDLVLLTLVLLVWDGGSPSQSKCVSG